MGPRGPARPAEFAHGVLATLGLERIGLDYERAALGIRQAQERVDALAAQHPPVPSADVLDAGWTDAPPVAEARRQVMDAYAAARAIGVVVDRIAELGETPDYDGAPC